MILAVTLVTPLVPSRPFGVVPVKVEVPASRGPVSLGAVVRQSPLSESRAARWPEARLRAVLLHESAHIRRRDLFFQLLAKGACAPFRANPLAWIHKRRLLLAGEKADDDQVVSKERRPSE